VLVVFLAAAAVVSLLGHDMVDDPPVRRLCLTAQRRSLFWL